MRCDLLISDRDAIEAVKRGELAEVSAGYEGEITYGDGTFSGETYQARQSDFRFNHILLLPSGAARLGPDTRIINKRTTDMAEYTVKQHFKNGARTFRFTNEADKEEAERMANEAAEEAKVSSAEEVENAMKSGLEQRCGGNFLAIFAGTVLGEKPNFTGRFSEW